MEGLGKGTRREAAPSPRIAAGRHAQHAAPDSATLADRGTSLAGGIRAADKADDTDAAPAEEKHAALAIMAQRGDAYSHCQ